jgi:hypothetical protein
MTTRLDLAVTKYPDHEAGIRALAERDPSGNLKYLEWGAKMLASGQALAPEVADVIDLFHQFRGQSLESGGARHARRADPSRRVHPDVHAYRPQDLANLRTLLTKIKRARDKKRRARERLYKIEGAVEAEVVHDSPDLVVRHVKNKQASAHYGLGTKWCITMLRKGYFDDYEAQNAAFFFFERKVPLKDEFDKVCLVVPRGAASACGYGVDLQAFTAVDRRVDIFSLARVYGPGVFDVLRQVHACSERYPGSAAFRVSAGTATAAECEAILATVIGGKLDPHETDQLIVSICCNDAAPWSLLETVLQRAAALSKAPRKRGRFHVRYHHKHSPGGLWIEAAAALTIHPQVPTAVREVLVKKLRRRHVQVEDIRRDDRGRITVTWRAAVRTRRRRNFRRFRSAKQMREHAGALVRRAARFRKSAKKLEEKERERKRRARVKHVGVKNGSSRGRRR